MIGVFFFFDFDELSVFSKMVCIEEKWNFMSLVEFRNCFDVFYVYRFVFNYVICYGDYD